MKLTLAFIAAHGTPALGIDDRSDTISSELVLLLDIFATRTPSGFDLQPCQRATPELKEKIRTLALQLKDAAPQLGGLAKFFGRFEDNEYFAVLPRHTQSTEEYLAIAAYLDILNGRRELAELQATEELFGPLIRQYDTIAYDNSKPVRIGAKAPEDKRCRFCGGTPASGVTFAKKAHAITEALGNKCLVLADECDRCNEHFGTDVEPSLINFLNVQRVFLGISGKGNKMPVIHYENATITHDGERMIVSSREISETPNGLSVQLGEGPSFVPEDCYRTLVKFALSTLEEEHLATLGQTIKWVRYAERPKGASLPLFYWGLAALGQKSSPSIVLQVGKNRQTSLPHILCEFRVGPFVFVFTLPFSDNDINLPADWFHTPEFKDTFRHYASVQWATLNFDSPERQRPPTVMTLTQREPSKGQQVPGEPSKA